MSGVCTIKTSNHDIHLERINCLHNLLCLRILKLLNLLLDLALVFYIGCSYCRGMFFLILAWLFILLPAVNIGWVQSCEYFVGKIYISQSALAKNKQILHWLPNEKKL